MLVEKNSRPICDIIDLASLYADLDYLQDWRLSQLSKRHLHN